MEEARSLDQIISNLSIEIFTKIEIYAPKVFFAFIILLAGWLIAFAIYKTTIYIFKRFKLDKIIDNLETNFWIGKKVETQKKETKKGNKKEIKKLTERIDLDKLVAKSFSYYIFLVFFRFSVMAIGITEVEEFLSDLIGYLPSLFVGILIGFFGLRFSDTVYNIVYHTLEITKERTGKIVAMLAKIIILFFTTMLVLNYIKIVDDFIINTFIIGFIAAISLGGAIAFWLWGKEIAKEILEWFRK